MTKKPITAGSEQPAFFVPDAEGHLAPTTIAHGAEFANPEVEQAAYLSLALSAYDSAALAQGFVSMSEDRSWMKALKTRYGANGAELMVMGKKAELQDVIATAKQAFLSAFAVAHEVEEWDDDSRALAEADYLVFEQEYRGQSQARREKRRTEQRRLTAKVLGSQATDGAVREVPPRQSQAEFNPRAPISLARALRPDFRGVDPANFEDLDWDFVNMLHPDTVLQPFLVDPRGNTRNKLHYKDDHGRQTAVTASSPEWGVVLRASPEFHANKAFNASEANQRSQPEGERDPDAPRRAGIHAVEGIQSTMVAYCESVLQPNLELIARFQEAAKYNGGLARFGNEANMRIQLEHLWQHVVADAVWAARVARRSNFVNEEKVLRGLEKAVFLAPNAATSRRNFVAILSVLELWTTAKLDYTNTKLAETAKYIYDNQTPHERASTTQRLRQTA